MFESLFLKKWLTKYYKIIFKTNSPVTSNKLVILMQIHIYFDIMTIIVITRGTEHAISSVSPEKWERYLGSSLKFIDHIRVILFEICKKESKIDLINIFYTNRCSLNNILPHILIYYWSDLICMQLTAIFLWNLIQNESSENA